MRSIALNSEYVELDEITMHYLDTKTEGELIICIHGLWGRGETWRNFMAEYGKKYRVIALDLRGHGYSDKPHSPYTAKIMCDDIAQLLNRLKIDSAIVLGHSQGGRIAAHLASHYPEKVKRLAILDKSANGLDELSVVDHSIIHKDPLTHDWPQTFKTLESARAYIIDTLDDALSYGYFMLSLIEGKNGFEMLFDKNAIGSLKAHDFSWFNILPSIKCPTLLMRTSSHEAVSDEDWNKMQFLLPNCTVVEMSHPNHNVHHSNTVEFNGYIDGFINTHRTESF